MEKLTLLAIGILFSVSNSFSQQKKIRQPQEKNLTQFERCATMERVDMLFRKFPEKKLLAQRLSRETPPSKALRVPKRLTSVVYIPVVFHIVLPNPYVISDDAVKSQIEQMNIDFAGLNADSTSIPAAFQTLRGHSLIQFVLAKRNPSGALSNGINRVSGTATGNPNNVTDSIKRASLGGADAWDPNSYLNIWIGDISSGQGVLGYTQIPGGGPSNDDGVFCNRLGFGISTCNINNYNKGRTIVHELGHYFGINHIWGDDENDADKCKGDDFRALTDDGSTYFLPTSLYNPHGKGNTAEDIGDTPNQAVSTNGCLTGIKTDACSSAAPGIMYQNFMDYTLDDCYSLFTDKQVARMEYVLDNFRTSLKTSLGGTVPANAIMRDAAPILPVNPGGIETSGCNSIYYPSTLTCAGSITPKVLIRNNGVNTINSLTVGYRLNGGSPVFVNLSPNLLSGATLLVTFQTMSVSTGTFAFKFFTSNVNGSGNDQVTANDTLTSVLNVPNPVALPLTEGFEGTGFPPPGWSITNPNNNPKWKLTTPGSNSVHSMYIDNFNNNTGGQVDEIRTPKLNLSGTDAVLISFDLAHKNYPDPDFNDRLEMLVSNDCGATYTSYFDKAGAALSTAGSSNNAYNNPVAGDWKKQEITLNGSILNTGSIIVMFRNTSDYGNNTFIDNISIRQVTSRDLSVIAVNPPAMTDCNQPTTPVATIKNLGFSTITGFKVYYTVDNGTPAQTIVTGVSLTQGNQMNVTLNTFTPSPGQHVLTVYSAEPISSSGTGDETKKNDTLRYDFSVTGTAPPPISEGFESASFPPANWALENPDGGLTWQRTTDAAKTGTASMVIRNFDYTPGTTDKLVSPLVSGTAAYDSMYVSFDYAYATGALTNVSDTLELQVTTDCGQTFTTVWKNWGSSLQTVAASSGARFVPGANDWKNVRLNLFNYIGTTQFQLYLVAKGNRQNNLYIDNINIYGVILPPLLKQQGYLIYPSPFRQQFVIRNYQVPTTLQGVHIYNSMGQLIWSKAYSGNAYTEMPVDLGSAPAGIYILKLQYSDKTVVERIVKQ
ncbi:MAG: choice-of-anchor J domain-containing protein [Ginsengibacter sp.]